MNWDLCLRNKGPGGVQFGTKRAVLSYCTAPHRTVYCTVDGGRGSVTKGLLGLARCSVRDRRGV